MELSVSIDGENKIISDTGRTGCSELPIEFPGKVAGVRSSTAASDPPTFSQFEGERLNQFTEIDKECIHRLVLKAPNKSCGLDPAPTWLVKEFADELVPFLTNMFNKSIVTGCFPELFKVAEVTPILKKPSLDASIPTNYRPISNLPFLSKLLERVINDQLQEHLVRADLLPEHQSAYRKSHSTETALLKVSSDALLAADRGMLTVLGMLDLSAAFDCVDHQILFQRLQTSFGIDSIALRWTKSYFRDRKYSVRYNGTLSGISTVDCGVPQGSVLGPLYFILYSSDVFALAERHGFLIHGYADDLQIYQHCFSTDMEDLNTRLSRCIEDIGVWMSCNRLKLNASKTEFIWFGTPVRISRNPPGPLIVGDSVIQPSRSVRSLGVLLDPALSLSEHVSKLTNRCYYQLRQLRSIRKSLSIDSCHALVRALILSRLDYCNGLLGGATGLLINQLNGVMRSSARLILQQPWNSHITDLMNSKLHWLDIRARIDFKLCLLAFRCLNSSAPRYLASLCTPEIGAAGRSHLRSAGSAINQLAIPVCKTKTIGPRAFAVSCPTCWNALPPHMRSMNRSLAAFRRELKTVLFVSMLERQR